MKGLIVGSGTLADPGQLRVEAQAADVSICADGGARYFLAEGLIPDVLVGDMDSIDPDDRARMEASGVQIVRHPVMKNESDMELAVRMLVHKDVRSIRMLGATGTRLDHTLANLMMIPVLHERGIELVIADQHNEISMLTTGSVQKRGTFFSVLPLDETVMVSLQGVKYPLNYHPVRRGTSLGISNEITGTSADVLVHHGKGLLIQSIE